MFLLNGDGWILHQGKSPEACPPVRSTPSSRNTGYGKCISVTTFIFTRRKHRKRRLRPCRPFAGSMRSAQLRSVAGGGCPFVPQIMASPTRVSLARTGRCGRCCDFVKCAFLGGYGTLSKMMRAASGTSSQMRSLGSKLPCGRATVAPSRPAPRCCLTPEGPAFAGTACDLPYRARHALDTGGAPATGRNRSAD
jgi:hypothetical protein